MPLLQIPLPTATPDSIPTPKEELAALKALPFDDMINRLVADVVNFAIHLACAILVFYIGRWIISKLYKVVRSLLVHRKVDRSLTTFVLSLVKMTLYFILIVTIVGILGLETSSFLAIFASAGVAIGMALSGTLQNFAGGVLILLLKPYRVGDYIEAQGYAGTVKEIQIFHTVILTYDNKSITIPNGGLSTGSINNWNREDYRRVDWTICLSYGDSVEVARGIILGMLLGDPRVVKEYVEDHREQHASQAETQPEVPETTGEETQEAAEATDKPERRGWLSHLFHRRRRVLREHLDTIEEQHRARLASYVPRVNRAPAVYLDAMADSSINLKVRAWVRTTDYWGVFYEMNERFYNELPKHGLSFPFPQLDVNFPGGVPLAKPAD